MRRAPGSTKELLHTLGGSVRRIRRLSSVNERKLWHSGIGRSTLVALLSIALVLGGMPTIPVWADELGTMSAQPGQVEELDQSEQLPEAQQDAEELGDDADASDTPAAQGEPEDATTSATFGIRASAQDCARVTTVTFVDEKGQPIRGAVIGTLDVTYTGEGSASDEANTIDMHGFRDKLDPALADEYEFSRVFVRLQDAKEKDFRYMQVGDDTAIGGRATDVYRAYLNMTGISQNADGQDFNGLWYQLDEPSDMDDIFIEFYHVAETRFYARDTQDNPVQGATFALFTDRECHAPLLYKNEEITATSNEQGLVSFGRIPQGTYYMKETAVPEGYQKSTNIYTVVVDGRTVIDDVIHKDDGEQVAHDAAVRLTDDGIVIPDVLEMTLTKKWDDNKNHDDESVQVAISARDEVVKTVTLDAQNNWTVTIGGLDPSKEYQVRETSVRSGGTDVTQGWVSTIDYVKNDSRVAYNKVDGLAEGGQYVMLAWVDGATRALSGGTVVDATPLETSADGATIAGDVTDNMLWNVAATAQDGVIALQNVAADSFLDLSTSGEWVLLPDCPATLCVRHTNDGGKERIYHRLDLDAASPNYLRVSRNPSGEGRVGYGDGAEHAAVFDVYRKVNVRTIDVTITGSQASDPLLIRSVSYPQGAAVPGTTFDLYAQDDYSKTDSGTPLLSSLTANEDGYLESEETGVQLELSAGDYVLEQTSTAEDEGYAPLAQPVKFTLTRNGALTVAKKDREYADFAYSTTARKGDVVLPVLQVPNTMTATLELTLDVQGDYADLTHAFSFLLVMPEGVSLLGGTVNGQDTVFDKENCTFELCHGQSLRLENVPAEATYVIMQTDARVAPEKRDGDGMYETSAQAASTAGTQSAVTVTQRKDNACVVTLANLSGSAEDPARVIITNTLDRAEVPQTGLADNAGAWAVMVLLCVCALAGLFLHRRRIRRG